MSSFSDGSSCSSSSASQVLLDWQLKNAAGRRQQQQQQIPHSILTPRRSSEENGPNENCNFGQKHWMQHEQRAQQSIHYWPHPIERLEPISGWQTPELVDGEHTNEHRRELVSEADSAIALAWPSVNYDLYADQWPRHVCVNQQLGQVVFVGCDPEVGFLGAMNDSGSGARMTATGSANVFDVKTDGNIGAGCRRVKGASEQVEAARREFATASKSSGEAINQLVGKTEEDKVALEDELREEELGDGKEWAQADGDHATRGPREQLDKQAFVTNGDAFCGANNCGQATGADGHPGRSAVSAQRKANRSLRRSKPIEVREYHPDNLGPNDGSGGRESNSCNVPITSDMATTNENISASCESLLDQASFERQISQSDQERVLSSLMERAASCQQKGFRAAPDANVAADHDLVPYSEFCCELASCGGHERSAGNIGRDDQLAAGEQRCQMYQNSNCRGVSSPLLLNGSPNVNFNRSKHQVLFAVARGSMRHSLSYDDLLSLAPNGANNDGGGPGERLDLENKRQHHFMRDNSAAEPDNISFCLPRATTTSNDEQTYGRRQRASMKLNPTERPAPGPRIEQKFNQTFEGLRELEERQRIELLVGSKVDDAPFGLPQATDVKQQQNQANQNHDKTDCVGGGREWAGYGANADSLNGDENATEFGPYGALVSASASNSAYPIWAARQQCQSDESVASDRIKSSNGAAGALGYGTNGNGKDNWAQVDINGATKSKFDEFGGSERQEAESHVRGQPMPKSSTYVGNNWRNHINDADAGADANTDAYAKQPTQTSDHVDHENGNENQTEVKARANEHQELFEQLVCSVDVLESYLCKSTQTSFESRLCCYSMHHHEHESTTKTHQLETNSKIREELGTSSECQQPAAQLTSGGRKNVDKRQLEEANDKDGPAYGAALSLDEDSETLNVMKQLGRIINAKSCSLEDADALATLEDDPSNQVHLSRQRECVSATGGFFGPSADCTLHTVNGRGQSISSHQNGLATGNNSSDQQQQQQTFFGSVTQSLLTIFQTAPNSPSAWSSRPASVSQAADGISPSRPLFRVAQHSARITYPKPMQQPAQLQQQPATTGWFGRSQQPAAPEQYPVEAQQDHCSSVDTGSETMRTGSSGGSLSQAGRSLSASAASLTRFFFNLSAPFGLSSTHTQQTASARPVHSADFSQPLANERMQSPGSVVEPAAARVQRHCVRYAADLQRVDELSSAELRSRLVGPHTDECDRSTRFVSDNDATQISCPAPSDCEVARDEQITMRGNDMTNSLSSSQLEQKQQIADYIQPTERYRQRRESFRRSKMLAWRMVESSNQGAEVRQREQESSLDCSSSKPIHNGIDLNGKFVPDFGLAQDECFRINASPANKMQIHRQQSLTSTEGSVSSSSKRGDNKLQGSRTKWLAAAVSILKSHT